MSPQRTEREHPRKQLANSYIEYSKEGTRLSRLFKSGVKRGLVTNISRTGVQFRTTEPVSENAKLYVTLRFPGVKKAATLRAETRWVLEERKIGVENYTHLVGAQFIEYSPAAWEVLQKILKQQ